MDMNTVARRIAEARKAQHLTQEDLAAKADISATHIGVIERCAKVPNLTTFVSIANALGVSADYLLQDVVDRSVESQATELSRLLSTQTPEMQKRIYKAIHALVDEQ